MMKLVIKSIALFLTIILLGLHVASCGIFDPIQPEESSNNAIVESVVDSILENIDQFQKDQNESVVDDTDISSNNQENQPGNEDLSLFPLDYEYYEKSTDTNVYALIQNELQFSHDTFIGKIILSSGDEVLGIAFTDYSNPYVNEDTGIVYYPTGFVSAIDELPIPSSDAAMGLEIIDIEENDEISEYKFIFTNTLEAFSKHVVFLDRYVKYGVNNDGVIWYEESEYIRGVCDENLGALFSYDENKFVYDPDVGEYVAITGESLSQCIDYRALETKINRILQEQDYNFSSAEFQTIIHYSQTALLDYWQSLTEETFMGYNVSDLIAIAQAIDPSSCLEITPDGLITVNISDAPPEEPTAFVKWMTGICCGIAIAGGLALSVVGSVPQFAALKGLGGAIIGAAMEITIQVIMENKALTEVDYRKVAIAALAGAISAYVGIFADALIGGVVEGVFTLMDGGTLGEAAASFALGSVAGLALGTAFNLAAKGLAKLAQKAAVPLLKKFPKILDSLSDNTLDYLMRKVGSPIGDEPSELWDLVASAQSKRLAKKIGGTSIGVDFIENLPEQNFINIMKKNSPKYDNWEIFDIDGVTKLTREQYENVARKNGNYIVKLKGEVLEIAQARYGKNITSITYIAAQPQFPNLGEVPVNLTGNRPFNMSALDDAYAKGVREGTITLSDEIKNYFARKGIDPSKVTKSQITKNAIRIRIEFDVA